MKGTGRVGLQVLFVLFSLWLSSGYGQSTSELPNITEHPQSIILSSTGSTTLRCTATSTTTITYSWLRNGVLIPGANGDTYVVTIAINGSGEYNCLVQNDRGTVSSQTAYVQEAVISDSFFSNSEISPRQVSVTMGIPLVISCGDYFSIPSTPLTWEIAGDLAINAATERVVYGLDGSLYLQDPNNFNNEIYECQAQNSVTREFVNGFVQVTVESTTVAPSTPIWMKRPQDTTVPVGSDAFFECITGGSPLPGVQWTVPQGTVIRDSQNNHIIRIRQVTVANAGVYSCSAPGLPGPVEAILTVAVPPVITTPLPNSVMSVIYGDPLTMACGSNSLGEWQWFFNGIRLAGENGSSLSLDKTTLDNDGVYQCYITNSAGFDSSNGIVEVRTIPASITTPLTTSQLIFRDQSFILSCDAAGAPPPSFVWMKESIPLAASSSFQISNNGDLTIVNVDGTSDGNYTCQATNSIGEDIIGTASTSSVLVTIEPTVLVQEPGPIFRIQVDTQGSLLCETISDPTAAVAYSWTKDGVPLAITGRISQEAGSGSITISQAMMSDAGLYVCTINTMKDGLMAPVVQSVPTNLTITEMPVAPVIIEVIAASAQSLEVQWHFPGSARQLSEYSIEFQSPGDIVWVIFSTQPASATTVATINNLLPYMEYNVRIVAKYTQGSQPETVSEVVTQRTLADIPSDSPSDVSAVAVSNTELRFSWTPPEQSNGPILQYIIMYRIERDGGQYSQANVSGSATSFLLSDLQPVERYQYFIVAVTAAGQGPGSPILTADTINITINEPNGPFYQQIWFIVLMVVIALVAITVIFGFTALVFKLASRKAKEATYHVGDVDHPDMSTEAFQAYSERSRRRDVELKMYNMGELDNDQDSNFVDSTAYTPQLSESSRTNLVHRSGAPGYIDPPTFEEAINRPRSQSMHSRRSSMGDKPPPEYWEDDNKSGLIDEPLSDLDDEHKRDYRVDYRPASRQESFRQATEYTGYELDDDSIGKPSFASEITDATEYSHLQAREGYSHLNTPSVSSNHATFV